MARRRKSFLSQFRSISRNIKTIFTSLVGLGIIGSIGYFSWGGLGGLFGTTPDSEPNIVVEMPPKLDTEIKIGTFNIENFGESQLGDPKIVAAIAHITMGFDVVAIQEISQSKGNALEPLIAKMNQNESDRFEYLISPLLGKEGSTSTEQFGFIYDTHRIELADEQKGFVVSNKKFRSKFDRLPVVSSFKVKKELAKNPFSFSLVTFHNVPTGNKRWKAETASIRDVYLDVREILGAEDDIILLGDFNAHHKLLKEGLAPLKQEFATAITVENTNRIQTESYDNLVFDSNLTTEFIDGHVFDFTEVCKKYEAPPEKVSDHFPVFATFGIEENQKVERVAAKTN